MADPQDTVQVFAARRNHLYLHVKRLALKNKAGVWNLL
jgi:hypothetical protein